MDGTSNAEGQRVFFVLTKMESFYAFLSAKMGFLRSNYLIQPFYSYKINEY
jgi:hypothetical protein